MRLRVHGATVPLPREPLTEARVHTSVSSVSARKPRLSARSSPTHRLQQLPRAPPVMHLLASWSTRHPTHHDCLRDTLRSRPRVRRGRRACPRPPDRAVGGQGRPRPGGALQLPSAQARGGSRHVGGRGMAPRTLSWRPMPTRTRQRPSAPSRRRAGGSPLPAGATSACCPRCHPRSACIARGEGVPAAPAGRSASPPSAPSRMSGRPPAACCGRLDHVHLFSIETALFPFLWKRGVHDPGRRLRKPKRSRRPPGPRRPRISGLVRAGALVPPPLRRRHQRRGMPGACRGPCSFTFRGLPAAPWRGVSRTWKGGTVEAIRPLTR